ncbi:B3 domain-containing protein [Hordeum vulgare]|nr:B3 domain-containing protein [Hordeum vulgare]
MKLRKGGNGLRKLWDVEVVFDTDGSMYLHRGWKQFVRAYDLRHGYFLVFRQVLPDNFVKMLDGHRPQNMKLRQAGNGLRKLWHVEVAFDTDGSMYLDRGWKQFVRAYDLRHGYFLVFRCSEYCDRCYVCGSSDSGYSKSSYDSGYSKSSNDSGYSKSSSDDGLAMVIPQLGDRAMPILIEEYIPQLGLGLRHSKLIRMMKEKVKKQE